jgi:hypothetical protein
MVAFRMAVLVVRFLVELTMLAGLAVAGAGLVEGAAGWALAIALPLVAVLVWWAFVAPKAWRPVPLAVRVAIELALFGATTALLVAVDRAGWGIAFAAVAVVTSVANAATRGITTPLDEPARAR